MHLSPSALQQLRERDPGALTAIVAGQSRRLYRTARGLGFDQADAEDLTQDVPFGVRSLSPTRRPAGGR